MIIYVIYFGSDINNMTYKDYIILFCYQPIANIVLTVTLDGLFFHGDVKTDVNFKLASLKKNYSNAICCTLLGTTALL